MVQIVMVPAHIQDVTDDKMKLNLLKNTAGPHLNHSINQFKSGNSHLSLRTYPDN